MVDGTLGGADCDVILAGKPGCGSDQITNYPGCSKVDSPHRGPRVPSPGVNATMV
jgi:hypothetical protein